MINTIIIGGGPAGLFAGNHLRKDFILLEKNNEVGKKLLITGNGMCNLTHSSPIKSFYNKYGDKKNIIRKVLNQYSPEKLLKYFQSRNISFITDENGKVFPDSRKAKDILHILTQDIQSNIITQCEVLEIKRKAEGFQLLTSDTKKYQCKNLVIATGGKTYPVTGSDGKGFILAETLGHHLIHPKPGLSGIKIENFDLSEYSGISLKHSLLRVFRNNKKIFSDNGDLVITHKGFSGPLFLHGSRFFEENDTLELSLIPTENPEKEIEVFYELYQNKSESIKRIIHELELPIRLKQQILTENNLSLETVFSNVSKKSFVSLMNSIFKRKYLLRNYTDWNKGMITVGGVDVSEIEITSMESRIVPNLFFCGEILDVDGDTGGYNLQFAFSSGFIAASKINSFT